MNLLFHTLCLMDIICFQHLLLTYDSFQRSFLSSGFLAIGRMSGINAGTTTFRSINHSSTGLAMQAKDTGNSWDKPCVVSPVNFLCLFRVSSWLPAVPPHLKQPFLGLNSFLPYKQSSAGHWLRKGANPWQGNSISQSSFA